MKKIVFSDVPMKKDLHKVVYKVDGNSTIEYDKAVAFPVNAVLAKSLRKDDDVKIVLLAKEDINGNSAQNVEALKQELDEINKAIGANIDYKVLFTPFVETRNTHENLLRDMVLELEDNTTIIGDITYGPKPLPIVMFNVLRFAERFFNSKIQNIVYGKVDFANDGGIKNPEIFDVTPLYYLNNVTNGIECKNSKDAVKMLDMLLEL